MKTKTKVIISTNPPKVECISISNNKILKYYKSDGNLIFGVFSNEIFDPNSKKEFSLSIETSILQAQVNEYFKDEPIEFEFDSFSPIGKHVKDYDIKGVTINQYKQLEDCEEYECGDYYFYVGSTLIYKEDMQMFESMVASFESDSGLDTSTVIKDILIPYIPESLKTVKIECKEPVNVNTPKVDEEPIVGPKKADFKGDWVYKKPSEKPFIYTPANAVYRDGNFQSINNLRFMCAVSEIAIFDKGELVKKENYFSIYFQECEVSSTGWDFYQETILPNVTNKSYIMGIMKQTHVRLERLHLSSELFIPSSKKVKIYKDYLQNKDLTLLEVIILSSIRDYKFKDVDAMIKKIGAIYEIEISSKTKCYYKKVIRDLEVKVG